MILTGDVGGTKVNLALFDVKDGNPSLSIERSYASRDHPNLGHLLEHFLKESRPKLTHACLGAAGPVYQGRCQVTHLPWEIDLHELKSLLGIDSVYLINDLAALAYAVPHLTSTELEVIHAGRSDAEGNIGVLAAGTGLGQAFLIAEREGRYRVVETEGGQCDFACRNAEEINLRKFVSQLSSRVCIEDVLSGSGLIRIFEFVKQRDHVIEPEWLAEEFDQEDPASVISRNGLSQGFKPCTDALELFVSIYGAVAGNLALQIVARGGVIIGGGIAPEILPLLKSDLFVDAFQDKGKFRDFMAKIPVKVVMNKSAPLLGAAYFALGENRIQ